MKCAQKSKIVFSNVVIAVRFSPGHLLILEKCETKFAGKALFVCLCGSILQSFLPLSFSLPCVHDRSRGLLVATNGSVHLLWDLSGWESVQCSAGSVLN